MRRLFAVASAFSLILFISAAVADVASHLTTFGWTSNHHHWSRGLFERAATTHNHYLIASKGILYEMGEESSDRVLDGRPFVDEHRVLSHGDVQGLNRDQTVFGFSPACHPPHVGLRPLRRAALAKERAALALRAPVRHPPSVVAVHIFA